MGEGFSRRTVFRADAEGYSGRDARQQDELQHDLVRLMAGSADAAGLDRAGWVLQAQGDGEVALLPPGTSEARFVDQFTAELHDRLDRYNHDRRRESWLRLRVGLHQGLVSESAAGFAGSPVVDVSRLVDCPAVKQALMEAPDAHMVLVLSRQLYNDLIPQRLTRFRTGDFREIRAALKGYDDQAWITIPGSGGRGRAPDLLASDRPQPIAQVYQSAPGPQTANHVHGDVRGVTIQFGNVYGYDHER